MASLETAWHLERREQERTALDTLPVADISKRPESVASALQQSQKANEVAGRIVGTERVGQIQQGNPMQNILTHSQKNQKSHKYNKHSILVLE